MKKGQVTIFLVIGIILLIAVVSYFAITQVFLKDAFQKSIESHKNVPEQIKPINDYLDSCTESIATDAINLLAIQGGLINLPNQTTTNPFEPLGPTLSIFNNGNLRTTVWFRETQNGLDQNSVPTKNQMQLELQNYLNDNFQTCINNLAQFSDQGFTISAASTITSKVTINDNTVNVAITSPVQVSKDAISYSLEDHLAQVNTRLGELYNMAVEILSSENKNFFLENKTLDMLIAYDPEIPFSGSSVSCDERTWSKSAVIGDVKSTLAGNVAAYRIKGTNYQTTDSKFNYLEFNPLSSPHSDVNVNFLYSENFPTSIDITPSSGDVLKEDSISKKSLPAAEGIISSFFCFTTHRFVYTIKYPLLITLSSPEGLTFQFATQVLIDRNEPRINREQIGNTETVDNRICDYPSQTATVESFTIAPSGNLAPLSGVDLSFKCFPVSCPLSETQITDNRYQVALPPCVSGTLEAREDGYYLGKTTDVSSNEQINQTIPIILSKIYSKHIKVFVIDKSTGQVRPPLSSEQVVFNIVNKEENTPYAITYTYPSDNDTINLIAGDYSITSYVTGNSTWPITTSKQTIPHCVNVGGFLGFGGQEQCTTTEIPETKIYTAMKGGANFDFTFTTEDLSRNGDLAIYTVASNIPSTTDEMAQIYQDIDTNKDLASFRYPEL